MVRATCSYLVIHYVLRVQFRYYLFPFILLFSTSSMFELYVVVVVVVMSNILELIMEIVPNNPIISMVWYGIFRILL
jgi:hypothetical protein